MKTVFELKEELSKFPDNYLCFAYEGESTGISVDSPDNSDAGGFIFCSVNARDEKPTVVYGIRRSSHDHP